MAMPAVGATDDIVARLRADRVTPTFDPHVVQVSPPSEMALEAATEIERLRKLTADFAKAIVEGDDAFPGDDWDDLLATAEKINPIPDDPDNE